MADGGIGEAALMEAIMSGAGTGAAIGGASSLLTGQDPLQGALRGGLMGGATGGIFNGMSGAMPGAAESATLPGGSASLAPTAGTQLGSSVADYSGGLPAPAAFDSAGQVSSASNPNMWGSETGAVTGPASGGNYIPGVQPAPIYAQGSGLPDASAATPAGAPSWWNSLSDKQKLLTGGAGVAGLAMLSDRNKYGIPAQKPYTGPLSRFHYDPSTYRPSLYAEGGITSLGGGAMMVGNNPQPAPDQYNPDGMGSRDLQYASSPTQAMASGGISSLGGYSDGGHLLKGPGDGMSDSIPASIAGKRPARLATDEFVVPADVVSHLGNGSSDAGAKQLYSMMEKVRKARTGRSAQGRQINPGKYLPA